MPTFTADYLTRIARDIFVAGEATTEVATIVAESLVLANLKGHDSHGVIRVINYVDWINEGWMDPSAELEVIRDEGAILAIDGHFGFGQVIGKQATEMAINKARKGGACILTIRRSGHLGRIGEWMEMGADAGLVCFSFTNTHGSGILVAPHGGRERCLSANPLGGGAPLPDGSNMVMDIATSVIADGKIKVASDEGREVPPNCIVDSQGNPTTSPDAYYADPPGALLPFGGHKGYALSMFAEVFAGALSGGGCSKVGEPRIANTWWAVYLDPDAFCGKDFYDQQMGDLKRHVKSSKLAKGFDEVLLPGEPEQNTLTARSDKGIPIVDSTWNKIANIAEERNVSLQA